MTLFTFYLPILICSLWLILFILNYFFYEYRSTLYKLITNVTQITSGIHRISVHIVLPSVCLIFGIYNIFLFYICQTFNNFTFLNINNIILMQLFYLNIIFFIIIFFFINFNKLPLNIDFIIFIVFLILITQGLLLFNNLLNIFFLLEIINMLILYSFINSITFRTFNIKNNYSTFWIIESCTYQFILNFIGSIIFYFFYNHLLIHYFSVNLFNLAIFTQYTSNWVIFNGLYLAFLIKFGIGPWLVYKVHMYKHFNILLLLIYTITYFLSILIFFLNLFFIYKFHITYIFINCVSIMLLGIFYLILVFLFNYSNFLVFMSLSSLINFILILFQLFIVVV